MMSDEIDYRLIGDDLQGVIVTLDPGEAVVAEAGAISIAFTKRIGVGFFGGEGFILQTLPFSRLADRIVAASPRSGGNRREEGSVLGSLGGLLDGDRR